MQAGQRWRQVAVFFSIAVWCKYDSGQEVLWPPSPDLEIQIVAMDLIFTVTL